MGKRKNPAVALSVLIIMVLACSILFKIAQGYAGTYTVTFTTGDVYVDATFIVRLDLGVSVQTSVFEVYSGGDGRMSIGVFPDTASISVTFQGNTYNQSFSTPLGSVKLFIYDIAGVGTLYARITGSVKTTVELKGPGSISPPNLSWTSEGSKSVSISHTGSMFSFDQLKIAMPFSYVLNLAVGVEALGTTLYEYPKDIGSLTGSPVVTESRWTFSIATGVIITTIPIVTGVVIIRTHRRKRKRAVKT